MFGNQTQSKTINDNNRTRGSSEICEFVVK